MEKDEQNEKIMGYKSEGEWGLGELLGGEDVLNMYRVRSSTCVMYPKIENNFF